MKRKLASLFFVVTSIGTAYAGGVSSTPNILNSIDEKSIEFLLTDERSATRGEFFHAGWFKSERTKAKEWCQGRGRCWVISVAPLIAKAIDVRRDGITTKSY